MRGKAPVPLQVSVVLLSVCLLGTVFALLALRTFFGTALNEPATIEVMIDAPEEIPQNHPFVVAIEVTSLITTSQTLHSIDLDSNYLAQVQLSGSTPGYKAVRSLPLTSFASYRYEMVIPAQQTVVIELLFEGQRVGEHSGLIDVCLADGTLCLARPIQTTILE